jgi:excisionase family DNA binding protein
MNHPDQPWGEANDNEGFVSMPAKPLSPETLGERWECSSEKIRQMFHRGEIGGFRLGKLIRIPAIEVERF